MFLVNSIIRIFLVTIYTIIVVSLITYCTPPQTTTTIETLYLQDAEVTGPINQPPIHLADNSDAPSITVTPRFSYNSQTEIRGQISGHTLVNEDGIFKVDTLFNNGGFTLKESIGANRYNYAGQYLTWNVATFYASLDLDFRLFRNFGAFFGVNYSAQSKVNIWGGVAGLGIFSASNNSAIRIDAGVNIQEIAYDATTVLIVKSTPSAGEDDYVLFENEIDKLTHFDPFISLTYNTTHRDWYVNFFLNAGYSGQTLIDFKSKSSSKEDVFGNKYIVNDLRGKSTSGFFNFTPGIYFFLGKSGRILLGARFFFQTKDKSTEPSNFILPMVQFDFRL